LAERVVEWREELGKKKRVERRAERPFDFLANWRAQWIFFSPTPHGAFAGKPFLFFETLATFLICPRHD
jgi:hypothetical protein